MERLEKIIPIEREAKITQGLLKTLYEANRAMKVSYVIRDSLPNISALIGEGDPNPLNYNYKQIFEQLCRYGYIKLIGRTVLVDVGIELIMPEEARSFFAKHYLSK